MKKILPWLLFPLAWVGGASFIKLTQIKIPTSSTPQIIYTPGDGTAQTLTLGSGLSISNGSISSISGIPTIVVTHVQSTTPNSFPIPAGRTTCLVSRNIPQSINEDYTIVSGSIVFNSVPSVDDIVQLTCF